MATRTALFLLFLLASPPAWAHGTVPSVTDIRVRPGDTSTLLIESNFGALISTDGGAHFDLICEFVLSAAVSGDPELLITEDGTMFAASASVGLRVSRNGGCTFDPVADFDDQHITALLAHPGAPKSIWLVTSHPGAPSALLRSDDVGVMFGPTPLSSPIETYSSLAVTPDRIYVGSWQATPPSAWLHRSDDDGQTFTSVAVPVEAGASFKVLGGSGAVVYAVILGDFDVSVLRSEAAGDAFATVHAGTEDLREVEVSADGQTVWLVGTHTLLRSTDGGKAFAPLDVPQLDPCAREIDGTLWACGWQPIDGWALATSLDKGTTFTPRLSYEQVRGVLSCPEGTDTHDVCVPDWPKMKPFFGIFDPPPGPEPGADVPAPVEEAPDAAVEVPTAGPELASPAPDAGVALDTAQPTPPPSSGGCSTEPGRTAGLLPVLGLLLGLALAASRPGARRIAPRRLATGPARPPRWPGPRGAHAPTDG